jgi:hypothetical protein
MTYDGIHHYSYDAEGNILTVDDGATAGSAACSGCSHIPHGDFEIRNVLERNYKDDLNKPVFSNNQMTPQ